MCRYIYIYICSSPPFFFFFFFAVVVLGVLLCIDGLMAVWHTSWPRVWFRLDGRSRFRWKSFQFFHIFQGKKAFWSLSFPFVFLFSCYFITFFLWVASLTSLVAHFALSLLSFLLIFRYALYLSFFSFLNFCLLSSFSLIFLYFPSSK